MGVYPGKISVMVIGAENGKHNKDAQALCMHVCVCLFVRVCHARICVYLCLCVYIVSVCVCECVFGCVCVYYLGSLF